MDVFEIASLFRRIPEGDCRAVWRRLSLSGNAQRLTVPAFCDDVDRASELADDRVGPRIV